MIVSRNRFDIIATKKGIFQSTEDNRATI